MSTPGPGARIGFGLAAGFVATVVLSILMLIKSAIAMMPKLDAIGMLSGMANAYVGLQPEPVVGWVAHFVIGTVIWGGIFAIMVPNIPGPYWLKGIIFSLAAWLLMMVVIMPVAGMELFGLGMGVGAPVATLILHIVFGIVLGAVYGWLHARATATAGGPHARAR